MTGLCVSCCRCRREPQQFAHVQVRLVMAAPVVALPERVSLETLRRVLRDTSHHGFPVVRGTASGKVGSRGAHITAMLVLQQVSACARDALFRLSRLTSSTNATGCKRGLCCSAANACKHLFSSPDRKECR